MRIFLAGATGAVGRPLTRLLVAAGHAVTGTTRSPHKAPTIEAAGATAAVVDAYDGDAVRAAVVAARPDVVIHQLTDLPSTRDPATYPAALAANARLRVMATPNLVVAARAAGARRFIAQANDLVRQDAIVLARPAARDDAPFLARAAPARLGSALLDANRRRVPAMPPNRAVPVRQPPRPSSRFHSRAAPSGFAA